jgi:hypothetical protein
MVTISVDRIRSKWVVRDATAAKNEIIKWVAPKGKRIKNMYFQFLDGSHFTGPSASAKSVMTHKAKLSCRLKLAAPHLQSGDKIHYALFLGGVNQYAKGGSPPTIIIQ